MHIKSPDYKSGLKLHAVLFSYRSLSLSEDIEQLQSGTAALPFSDREVLVEIFFRRLNAESLQYQSGLACIVQAAVFYERKELFSEPPSDGPPRLFGRDQVLLVHSVLLETNRARLRRALF